MMHGTGVLLLAAVAGYWVVERSLSHKGSMRRAGQILGTVVIVLSIAGAVCQAITMAVYGGRFCPMPGYWGKKSGFMCPMTGMPMMGPAGEATK